MTGARRRTAGAWAAALLALSGAVAGCGGGGSQTATGSSSTTAASARVEIVTSTTGPDGSGPTVVQPAASAPAGAAATAPSAGTIVTTGKGQPGTTAKAPPLTKGANGGYTVVAQATVPSVVARARPEATAEVVATLANPIESGAPLVFAAVPNQPANAQWLQVRLPVKPNGTVGWIDRSQVKLYGDPYRIEINRAAFNLRVYKADQVWVEAKIGVGTGDTPTPVGEFYLTELLAPPNPNGAYGPYAFGLSGFSETLASFGGSSKAVIGIHGTNDPRSLGSNISHGCIRVDNKTITQLARTLPLGTPVVIS